MTQISTTSDSKFSEAMGLTGGHNSMRQGNISMLSNDSDSTTSSDSSGWFKTRPKSVTTVSEESYVNEGQSYELGHLGVTMSAFKRHDSVDSYSNQSIHTNATSRVDFDSQSQITDSESDDGRYYPLRRQMSNVTYQSSNHSLVSVQSDDSTGYYDVDKTYRDQLTL
ncbi:hypothetical protein PsorP6_003851 [Peronosclerospora sorghi]|uniref:Uncharacterized protein n=1 Tax=Peronosclerospora sorghi TaxID=230839 RepID=A0ACC0VM82_9STRA|nr:hypothetical protein PsorP6_003851 [Peronosclerospora sorghi]